MTLSELVAATILKATGKVAVLAFADKKYQKVLGIANPYIEQWQNTKDVDWSSLYDSNYEIGTVTANNTFELDDEIRKFSDTPDDYVEIINGTQITRFKLVSADSLKRYSVGAPVCAQIGRTLVFRSAFATDSSLIGATITAPVYLFAEKLTSASSEVPVDIPQWLVLMCAAEYVRNDVTKQNQYPNLIAEANEILDRMIDDNDGQIMTAYIPNSQRSRTW